MKDLRIHVYEDYELEMLHSPYENMKLVMSAAAVG